MGRHLRNTVRAAVFCTALLIGGFVLLFHTSAARPDPIAGLLKLPAPAPPNPLVHSSSMRSEKVSDPSKPPDDNAPIEELIEYWTGESTAYNKLRYNAEPSDRTRDRLLREVQDDPKLLANLLNIFNNDTKAADAIYQIFNREGTAGALDRDSRKIVRDWLKVNSTYFSQDLAVTANEAGDAGEYVQNQEDLLALTRVDFDRARPIIDRLYSSPEQKVGPVLAKWALYRHALDSGSSIDADRYRRELQDVVEDKRALPGARDLAIDALAQEKDWPGRDEWYISLFGDETLSELKVNGQTYTGLTTMMMVSPPDRLVPRMIELLKTNDPVVRANVVKNLITKIDDGGPEVVRALLPWLEDEKWAKDNGEARAAVVRKLAEFEMPESVPGLIKVLEEKRTVMVQSGSTLQSYSPGNSVKSPNVTSRLEQLQMANALNAMANASIDAPGLGGFKGGVSNSKPISSHAEEQYPYRSAAVYALAKQKDIRAVPALKRALNAVEGWERESVVKAIFVSGGFTLSEQLDALETAARGSRDIQFGAGEYQTASNAPYNVSSAGTNMMSGAAYAERLDSLHSNKPLTPLELRETLGRVIITTNEVSDDLARAVVARIEDDDKRDPGMAEAYRKIVLQWPNAVINMLFLRDTKRDVASVDTILRLLSQRKQLREKQLADVSDLRTGSQRATGIAACIFEDRSDYDTILDSGSPDAKAALLACGRLIRAPLNVAKVIPLLSAKEPLLAAAADRFLESEDSPAARAAVLARHQGEARIMGAMTAFKGSENESENGVDEGNYEAVAALFQSLGDQSLYNGWAGTGNDPELVEVEKRLQAEVKRDTSLIGIYAYDRNYIRIYADKAVYSFEEDDSRYHERPLTHEEFEDIKSYVALKRADEMPPFLYCGGQYCTSKELLMIGRNGGRRVYIAGDSIGRDPDFFAGLNKFFDAAKKEPGALKYALSREVPGLEIVSATDAYDIATVWGDANGVTVAAGEKAARDKVKHEIAAMDDPESKDEGEGDQLPAPGEMSTDARAAWHKRRWEGYGWYTVASNGSLESSVQPAAVDFIAPQGAEQDSWKTRAGSISVRATDDGLYKVQAGRSTKLVGGEFSHSVISADGRWLLVNKQVGDDGAGFTIERVDMTTRREYPVVFGNEYGNWIPKSVIPGTNAIILEREDYNEAPLIEEEDTPPETVDATGFKIIDGATGNELEYHGELRPFAQTTFRPLQRSAKPGELWVAIPDSEKNGTDVGTIDTRTFTFSPVLRVPKIKFDSMRMWVDEPHQKLYFVYRGHLLSLPLKTPAAPATAQPMPSTRH